VTEMHLGPTRQTDFADSSITINFLPPLSRHSPDTPCTLELESNLSHISLSVSVSLSVSLSPVYALLFISRVREVGGGGGEGGKRFPKPLFRMRVDLQRFYLHQPPHQEMHERKREVVDGKKSARSQ
jgi:hypothetical protein